MSAWSRPFERLPAHVVNGTSAALGIAAVHLLISALAGPAAAQLATSGTIFASLADTPLTPARTRRHVLAAALLGCLAAVVVTALRPHPVALGAAIAVVVFGATMTLAWGPRAGPVSFAPVLAIVFTMALPRDVPPSAVALWNGAGALGYLAWASVTSRLLQPRYRSLALASAIDASARLLRLRAELLRADGAEDADRLQRWVRQEAVLAERLQAARDLLFAAADTPRVRRETAMLLRTIDLRDILLASRLDLELLGDDAAAQRLRKHIAYALATLAERLDDARAALRGGPAAPPAADVGDALFDGVELAADDPRRRLLPALAGRVRHLHADVDRIGALLRGADEAAALTRAELRLFVAPEGWPLAALRPHRTLGSPLLRHALRAALALTTAYAIAFVLPWASHPQWLVLSVAVVLRGNLEQTLARRNLRVVGTLFGCVLVLALAHVPSTAALMVVFLGAAGLAHSFAVERYLVTATAATVMSLLQAHLVNPIAGFPIGERVADTILGAALAWGFSYVLPSWERRSLPRALARALAALRDYAVLAVAPAPAAPVEQRLARRQAYDALGALATTLQRSAAEPARVRPPVRELALVLDHGQRLMAHLSMVRLTLARHAGVGSAPQAAPAMQAAAAAFDAALAPLAAGSTPVAAAPPAPLDSLPPAPPRDDALPWLLRRLDVAVQDARHVALAARAALARLKMDAGRR